MAKRTKKTTYFPTKLPIPSLSGGVGRQAPNKRLPNEAEELINVFCTTERSIDRRNGFEITEGLQDLNIPNLENKEMWWYWFNAGVNQRYLFGINFNATQSDDLLFIYRISEDSTITQQNVDPNIDQDILNYITYSSGVPRDILRACAIGSSVLILNTKVKAGFTSDGVPDENGKYNLHDFDGTKIPNTEDLIGLPLKYKTSASVDRNNEAEVWSEFSDYVWGQKAIDLTDSKKDYLQTDEDEPLDNLRYGIWQVKSGLAPDLLPGPTNEATIINPSSDTTSWERVDDEDDRTDKAWSTFIDPKDYVYPDGLKAYLGQSVSRLSELKFPPKIEEVTAYNGDSEVQLAIKTLYPNSGDSFGRGKLYYLSQAFLSSTPGYYRVVSSEDSPYLEKIRTPDKMSVIDANRMPMQIFLDAENNQWSIRKIDWNPRTSGSISSNPGPSIFSNDKKEAVQKEIKALSFYRDRLFLASEDTLVSSELGNFSNFFLKDPASIVYTDPIDLSVSSNVYTPITFLKPFKDFLFLGTSGDTQYELVGSENQISPLTAEIAPTSFFPMTEDVEPLVMNNNLFFFSKKRLFIYFQRFEAAGQQAFELSRHVPDYLPDRFLDTTVSTAHNMIFALEGTSPSGEIYCYRNQVSGDQIVQNAFFKFQLDGLRVATINAIEDDLYAVVLANNQSGNQFAQILKMSLIPEEYNLPRIDARQNITLNSAEYDSETNQTIFTYNQTSVKLSTDINIMVFPDGSQADVTLAVSNEDDTLAESSILKVTGNFAQYTSAYVGIKFKTTIEISTQYVRDQQNTIVPGSLNLRYGVIRHRYSGNYNVEVSRKEREARVYNFDFNIVGEAMQTTDGLLYEKDGTFKFPIMGFSDDLIIRIVSDFPNPMNLTNIELTGKFKRTSKFITT